MNYLMPPPLHSIVSLPFSSTETIQNFTRPLGVQLSDISYKSIKGSVESKYPMTLPWLLQCITLNTQMSFRISMISLVASIH